MNPARERLLPFRKLLAACAVGGSVWIAPSLCLASRSFVPNLKTHWDVTALPVKGEGCLLCHRSEAGGSGTATQPFARTLTSKYQLSAGDLGALAQALESDRANADDSDRDGVDDYAEIVIDGTNPNDPKQHRDLNAGGEGGGNDGAAGAAGAACYVPSPPDYPTLSYGCAFASRAPLSASAWAITLFGGAWLARRRSDKRARR